MSSILKEYTDLCGTSALFDDDRLREYMIDRRIDKGTIYSTLMILNCSFLRDFVENNNGKLSSVAVNTMIMNCIEITKLSPDVVRRTVFNALDAAGMQYSFETFYKDASRGKANITQPRYRLHETAFIPDSEQSVMWTTAEGYENSGDYGAAYTEYKRLANAGNSAAMFRIAEFYRRGLGTNKDEDEALRWYRSAAENGDMRANKYMGDYYYENEIFILRDFEQAYKCYSSPGVLATDARIADRIVDIINQKSTNIITLILSGIAVILMWAFIFLVHTGVHSGGNLIGWGIGLTAAATLVFGAALFVNRKSKYRNVKYFVPLMTVIWAVYPLILVIN